MSLFFYKNEGTIWESGRSSFLYFVYILKDPQNKPVIKWSNYGSIMGSFISLYFYRKMVYLFKDLIEDI